MAYYAARWIYYKILFIAKAKGLVDNPNARKLQRIPIPVMGGIVAFFGVAMGLLVGFIVRGVWGDGSGMEILPVVAAMVIMLYVGAVDDIMGLTPRARFAIEVITVLGLIYSGGGCVDSFHGMWGIGNVTWWIAVPLTVIGGVGLINAINMVDGVNGLASMLSIVGSVFFGVVFFRGGDVLNAMLAFCTAAAIVPFMIRNIFGLNSRMFLGDAGTMVIGVLMTWFSICLLRSDSPIAAHWSDNNVNTIAFVVAVFSVPLFDTLRVMFMRIMNKKSPFYPDKTHLHHIFVNIGLSHFFTALTELLMMILVVVLWMLSLRLGASMDWQCYIVIIASMLLVWGTYAFMHYHAKHHTETLHRLVNFSTSTHLGRKEWWKHLSAWLDAPEVRLMKNLEIEDAVNAPLRDFNYDPADPDDIKEQDRKKILDFMRGRAEVYTQDIIDHSGADPWRVYAILFEEETRGRVRVIQHYKMGAPEIVSLYHD